MIRRRGLLAASLLSPFILAACKTSRSNINDSHIAKELADLEKISGGRLGVGIWDSATGELSGHRLSERFGMCSTFKLPLAAMILREIETGKLASEQWIPYSEADMLSYAPVTRKNLAKGGMTVLALAEATQKTSDNPAANLLLKLIGGPQGFTKRLRSLGDGVTRLDRDEPMMNLVLPGDERDTTTPAAMAQTVARFFNDEMIPALNGEYLTVFGREKLKNWAVETKTGLKRLRAGLPPDWTVGDKTGTGIAPAKHNMANMHNDIAICWPPGRSQPIVIAAYYQADAHYNKMRPRDDAVLAKVGQIVAATMT